MWSVFKLAARAAVWRTTPDPPLVGLPSLLGWAVTLAVMRVALQFAATAGGPSHFNPYGLNAVVAWLAFQLAIAAFFVRPRRGPTALAAMFILSIIADVAAALIQFGGPLLPSNTQLDALWSHAPVAAAFYAIEIGWWLGAMTCVLGSVQPNSRLRLLARAAALWVALVRRTCADARRAGLCCSRLRYPQPPIGGSICMPAMARKEVAQLEKEQSDLLKTEVDTLAPQRKGTTDIYVIGLAGWANQDVFVKELDGALTSIGTVLPIKDHTLRLINNRETVSSVPLATPKNFSAAVHAVGAVYGQGRRCAASCHDIARQSERLCACNFPATCRPN